MTIRQNVPNGAPCWIDLMSSDTDKSRAFYGELFGWTADEPNAEFGGYTNFRLDGEHRGRPHDRPRRRACPMCGRCTSRSTMPRRPSRLAKANGGQVFVEPMAVGDLGTMAVLADAGGAMIGMWQPGEHRGGVVARDGRALPLRAAHP